MPIKAHPVALVGLALVAAVVAAVTVLSALHDTIPTFLPEVGFAVLTGALGVTVPGSGSSSAPPSG